MKQKETILNIIIGGDFNKDFEDLLQGKKIALSQTKNAIYLNSFEQLNKLLSPKKLDLLNYLIETKVEKNPKSITTIAKELNRKQEAISRDIKQLSNLGVIIIKKIKQTVYAIPKYHSIQIITTQSN